MKTTTIHVLAVWPRPTADTGAVDTAVAGQHALESVVTFVEHGTDDTAWRTANSIAGNHRDTGRRVELITVAVEVDRPDPTALAVAAALHKIGHRPGPVPVETRIRRARARAALAIDATVAADLLTAGLALPVGPEEQGWGLVLLRLSRRAACGDPFAALALTEFAGEHRAALDPDAPSADTLTLPDTANTTSSFRGGRSRHRPAGPLRLTTR